MKIKVKVLKKILEKAIQKQGFQSSGLDGLKQFDDSINDFSDNDELDLADVISMIATDVAELEKE